MVTALVYIDLCKFVASGEYRRKVDSLPIVGQKERAGGREVGRAGWGASSRWWLSTRQAEVE